MPDLHSPVTEQDHIVGDSRAPLTLIEYGDFQCPHCLIAHKVVKQLQRHFGARMRFVFRNFPLVEIHPMAEPAAEAAEYTAAQDPAKYWPMVNAIFAHQGSLTPELLATEARKLGLDSAAATDAIHGQRFATRIERDVESGKKAGVHGTPTFFLNGKHYTGPWEYEPLKAALEAI